MAVFSLCCDDPAYPAALGKMHRTPEPIYINSDNWDDIRTRPKVAVVGSRQMSPYGQQVTHQLAGDLARQGIVIVSGLALGVDGAAHQAALEAGGLTLAVLPTPLERIAPAQHERLARKIVQQGGALVSSYPPGSDSHKGNFVARNELVAAISDVVLITEAGEGSGSLHTAKFAQDMGVTVMAVPGSITNRLSVGTNRLLDTSAHVATTVQDILFALDITGQPSVRPIRGANATEQLLLDHMQTGICDGAMLLQASRLPVETFNQTITMLEITGKIRALGGNQWAPG